MHKTVTASIGNALFVIEESAYARLDAYLRSVRNHFAPMPDADEIVADIESRIAEAFSAKMTSRKKLVLEKDVREVINAMGTVEDFENFEGEEAGVHSLHDAQGMRMYRDGYDQVIGGVCSGIAQYFDVDPVLIRLAFALSVFFGGFGIVLYIILWIILPEARTAAEKVEMSGGRVTLSSLKESVHKNSVRAEKRNGALRTIMHMPFQVIGSAFRGFGAFLTAASPVLARIVGIVILLGAAFAVSTLTMLFFTILADPTVMYDGYPIREMLGHTVFTTFVFAGYLLLLIPILFVLLFGIGLMLLRSALSPSTATILGVAWFGSLTMVGITAFLSAPRLEEVARLYHAEERDVQSMTLDLDAFDRISAGGNTSVSVTYGEEISVEARGSRASLDAARIGVQDGRLEVGRRPFLSLCFFLCSQANVHLDVRMPEISSLDMSGASRAVIDGFDQDALSFRASGAARIDADIRADVLTAALSGASRITLRGSGSSMDIALSGASRMEAADFFVTEADIRLSGGSRAAVNAQERLEGVMSGGSRLTYRTEPEVLRVDTSGGSRLEREQ